MREYAGMTLEEFGLEGRPDLISLSDEHTAGRGG
jgi:hypothetical protein